MHIHILVGKALKSCMHMYTVYAEYLESKIFGELIENRCWRHFNLAKGSKHSSYKLEMALFKFGD